MTCPACSQAMRAEDTRLVCDHCRGVMLGDDELVKSIEEIRAAPAALEAVNQRPSQARCPRCGDAMVSCALRLGAFELAGRYLRCARDGVFMSNDDLLGTYARASHAGNMKGRTFGGYWGDVGGGLKSVGEAFSRSNAPSAIFGGARRVGPRVRAVFDSAFRGRVLSCPVCAGATLELWGDRWRCDGCAGAFVENAALAAMISDLTGTAWQLPASTGSAGARACPACAQPMSEERDAGVTIDRCAAHGTWFDERELEAVLMHAADPPPAASTVGGWLRRLFRARGS